MAVVAAAVAFLATGSVSTEALARGGSGRGGHGGGRGGGAGGVMVGVTPVRKTAGSFEKALRNTSENQPYTAVVVALALGWLFGRMHRPL